MKQSRPPTPTSLPTSSHPSPIPSPLLQRVPLPNTTSPTVLHASLPGSPSQSLLSPPGVVTPHSAMSHNGHSHHGSGILSPTPGYTPKVSFDTFENPVASMFSYTLQVKSDGYKRTRSTRVFLCAASPDESGMGALDWCLEALVQDGDELIVFRGVDEEVLEKDHDILREDARDLMKTIQEKSVEYDADRKLSLVLEYIPGKITDTLDRLIALYRPDSIVVGTRGRKPWQAIGVIGMGSVSKYCLSHSPVPVIVVRPERKLKKAVEKRRADPKRGRHFE
ncbi:hypothetical protein BDQ17DRAFT_1244739 [Cyathus striatus]|nr:hypothetical protein BDQ17DRAFT_1244739 [Cyathus striatus]